MNKILFLLLLTPYIAFSMSGLEVGDMAPNLKLKNTEGKIIDFSDKSLTTIAIFYRGSWCPYCVTQLKSVELELAKKVSGNKQIVAISVDQLIVSKKMKRNHGFTYNIISDPKAESLKEFKIINKLSDKLVSMYKSSYSIDVEADSGEKHHMIAHPAVFIINKGKIVFSDIHLNYKQRTENSEIIKALKQLVSL